MTQMYDPLRIPLIIFGRHARRLWVRVAFYAALAIVVAIAGALLGRYLPAELAVKFSPDTIMPVLTILASSMLAVSTFSLNVMVSAHRTAAQNATPRIRRILLEDTTTQNVLATFIGAFVYALTAIIVSQLGGYSEEATFLVIIVTVLVALLVVLAMLRWIEHLGSLGSLDENLKMVHQLARQSIGSRARYPALSCTPIRGTDTAPKDAIAIGAARSGYVQLIDVKKLDAALGENEEIHLVREPGRHVLKGETLAKVTFKDSGETGDERDERLAEFADCFIIGDIRTHEQDPEFGLLVMSEISSKALSPGVNDPGTAIEAIGRLKAMLWDFATAEPEQAEPEYKRIHFAPLTSGRLLNAAFGATARDGAGTIEVAIALRQTLRDLATSPNEDLNQAARSLAERAMAYGDEALAIEWERERLRQIRIDN